MAGPPPSCDPPAMTRSALLLAVGLGYIALPHAAWLAVLAVVAAALLAGPGWWRKPRSLTVQVDPATHHFHYCPECDEQWAHAGEGGTCIRHWAAPCAACALPRSA
jgi:hypothetical protein